MTSLFNIYFAGRPEPSVTWIKGNSLVQTAGAVSMGRHVSVNRLEVFKVGRDALNTTFKCQASNTKLVPPVERSVRLDMLRKYSGTNIITADFELIIPLRFHSKAPQCKYFDEAETTDSRHGVQSDVHGQWVGARYRHQVDTE